MSYLWAGALPVSAVRPILVYYRDQYESVDEQTYQIKKRFVFARERNRRQRGAIRGVDGKGDRKKEKEAVARESPKAQEEQCGRQRSRGNGAEQESIYRAHSASQIKPYSNTTIAISAVPVLHKERYSAGTISLSTTSRKLFNARIEKHSPLQSSNR